MKLAPTLLLLTILLTPGLLLAQEGSNPRLDITQSQDTPQQGGRLDPSQAQDTPQQPAGTTNQPGSSTVPPASGAPTTQTTQEPQAADAFVSLTRLPGITELNNSIINVDSLPELFNNLYRLCIGAAAVIAVIQIMRAGIKFMTKGGSVSANTEAKQLIYQSVLGLVLVLSPAIVFGIINPRILNLELDLGGLNRDPLERVDLTQDMTSAQCRAEYTTQTPVIQSTRSCEAQLGEGFESVISSCCDNYRPGYTCCARKKSTDPEAAKKEYWWRVAVRAPGAPDASIVGSVSPRPPVIEQSPKRFPTQQECVASYNQAMFDPVTLVRKEITKTYCDCSKPRSEFPDCKE